MNEPSRAGSDVELLRVACDDPDAFGEFYRRHAVAVEHWVLRYRIWPQRPT